MRRWWLVKSASLPIIFNSIAVFLFSAILLIIPSGYSIAPLMLLIASLFLIGRWRRINLNKSDWMFIFAIFTYFVLNALLNLGHGLSASAFDRFTRYLVSVPVYILLICFPPKPNYFWCGLLIGAVGAFIIAIYQQYFVPTLGGRSNGFINTIQFGDISILVAGLALLGVRWVKLVRPSSKILVFIFFFASVIGFIASFLSFSRGSLLVIPVILFTYYKIGNGLDITKKLLGTIVIMICLGLVVVLVIPKSNFLYDRLDVTRNEINTYFYGGEKYTSLSSRIMMWENGLDAFKEKPIFGWGDVAAIKSHYSLVWEQLDKLDDYNHLHNEYIDTLATRGLVGFFSLMILYLVPLHYFLNLIKRIKQGEVVIFAYAGVLLITCSMIFGFTQCFLSHISGATVFIFYLVIITAFCRNFVESDGFSK